MERKFIRMTRKEYEEKMKNTELYFIEDVPENEKCPVCGEHDFFCFEDFGSPNSDNKHVVVRTRQTGRELLDFLANAEYMPERIMCACCKTQISHACTDKIIPDKRYKHLSPKLFNKMIAERFNGDKMKFAMATYAERDAALQAIK